MIEILAGTLLLAGAICLFFRSLRIHRFKSRLRDQPPGRSVTLATIVKEIYPEVSLCQQETKDTHNGRRRPAWSAWLQQHDLDNLSIIRDSSHEAWRGAVTLHALRQIDGHVFESVAELVHRRLHAFSDLDRPFQWWLHPAGTTPDADEYDRRFAERIVVDHLSASGHDVVVSDATHRTANHFVVDGKPFLLNQPFCFDYASHFAKYPGIGMITPADFFDVEDAMFAIDPSPGAQRLSAITGTGLDRTLFTNQALAQDPGGVQVHGITTAGSGSLDYHSPLVTLGLSSLREIRLLKKRHTDLKTATRNIGLDVAGTGVGGFAGAKAGATLGTAFAPGVGSVVGAIIGGIGGAFAGRSITNKIKLAEAEQARSHYEEKVLQFERRLNEVTGAARATLETKVNEEQSVLRLIGAKRSKEFGTLTARLESLHRHGYVMPAGDLRKSFARCETAFHNKELELKALLSRISFWKRTVWPSKEAVRLSLHRNMTRTHHAELSRARSCILDPRCTLNDVEKTDVSLELLLAFGGHEEEIRRHLARSKKTAEENLATLAAWSPPALRELAQRRSVALKRITARTIALRRWTEVQLKSDVRKAKRAQNRFARELRKLGLGV